MKRFFAIALLVFALGSLIYRGANDALRTATAPAAEQLHEGVAPVTVYFFDSDKQCATCDHLKEYAAEAIQTYFSSELESGTLAWRTLNLDDPANEHYLEEYGLYSKSVVVVRAEAGKPVRWKNLESIWELVYDKRLYLEYIRAEVEAFLGEAS
jgi:hypothetical protein